MRNNKAKNCSACAALISKRNGNTPAISTSCHLCRFVPLLRPVAWWERSGLLTRATAPSTLLLFIIFDSKEEQTGTGRKCQRRSGFSRSTCRNRADQSGTMQKANQRTRTGRADSKREDDGTITVNGVTNTTPGTIGTTIANKYRRWHDAIIERARARSSDVDIGYCERHHVLPKSSGGSTAETNIVKLAYRERHRHRRASTTDGDGHHER